MYWIYLILFILAVLVPDIMDGRSYYFLSETHLEEISILLLGMAGFFIFIFKERQLSIRETENVQDKRKLFRANKDLAESYSYIGEVNRKMEILMQIALGLNDRSDLTKSKEKEIYNTILAASNSIVKAKFSCLRFVDMKDNKTQKEVLNAGSCKIRNAELLDVGGDINIKKNDDVIIVSSLKEISGVRCYLIIQRYDEAESGSANNQEMLKFLASQALFLYSYMSSVKK
ncbi:MAG TPA: hypothetical protein DIT25_04010 [Candidatus Moranbacteria bacterium]|nr:hypothetical protein [Candidatus Moranbacteria bacterium]